MEIQLIAKKLDATKQFAFEIFSQDSAEGSSWARRCSGRLETQIPVEPSTLSFPDQDHDQALMNLAQTLEPSIGESLSNLRLNREGSSGEFRSKIGDLENHAVDPLFLNFILRLSPMSLLSQTPLAEYRLSTLTSLTVSTQPQQPSYEHFATHIKPSELGFVESDSDICPFGKLVSLRGMRYEATKMLHQTPPLDSLFFKPVLIPDITRLSTTGPMSISRCAELLSHKWPSCDIEITDVPERFTVSILEAFGAHNTEARSKFRSIRCPSIPPGVVSDRVQLVDGSQVSIKYHMIFAQNTPPEVQLSDQLHPGGLLCIPKAHVQDPESHQRAYLEFICDINGLALDPWVLLRQATDASPVCPRRKIVVFADGHGLRSLSGLARMESIPLEPSEVARFCEQSGLTRFDAVIIDCPERPVITTWTGTELMPWFQTLLKCAQSILWVTRDHHKSPFSNAAGSLLRTLQAEQPSLKISWLVTNESAGTNRGMFATEVEQAYVRMIEGDQELVRTAGGFGEEILRYIPDDCLSAYTGLRLPQEVRSPLGEADYSLDIAAPGEPVILSHKGSRSEQTSDDIIEVLVEASVVDIYDLQGFHGEPNFAVPGPDSGLFFAGKVLNSLDPELRQDSRVVGWHSDPIHRKKVNPRPHDVCRYPDSLRPSQAASKYMAIAVASCIVDGVARARQGETFLLNFQGPLLIAVEQVCRRLGASMLRPGSSSIADFVITFHRLEGIRVNDRPIDVASYLHSEFGRGLVQRIWQELANLLSEVDDYEIADHKEAYSNSKQPYSTVLLHHNAANILQHVPIYKKATELFMEHVSYIVVGGLGGLGRFICSWMIEKGARYITIISRSGASSQDSGDAISALSASGASIQCIKADACDRKAISEILYKLRKERCIKGIINLAMVLGDSPMATMTPQDWDRVLHVKIQSSRILHEETLQDELDLFILFSSIASVLGNRNQGSYNVANAALNALAEYRQSLDLPGISVALGAMSKY